MNIQKKPKIIVKPVAEKSNSGTLSFNGKIYKCMIGREGAVAEQDKVEGDWKTPIGEYSFLKGFYRADRLEKPETAGLEMVPIADDMGWDDDPKSKDYNCWVQTGYPKGEAESFWRGDALYDVILVLDHNAAWPYEDERPASLLPNPQIGSAIFMHVMKKDDAGKPKPTAGCISLEKNDLLEIMTSIKKGESIAIEILAKNNKQSLSKQAFER